MRRKIYVNFHTATNPGGEIRGQVGFGSDAVTGVKQESHQIPSEFSLGQNYPNPFNPETMIPFSISDRAHVQLKIFDILGREAATLVNESLAPGSYSIRFGGEKLSTGIYYYQLSNSTGFREVRKMMILK